MSDWEKRIGLQQILQGRSSPVKQDVKSAHIQGKTTSTVGASRQSFAKGASEKRDRNTQPAKSVVHDVRIRPILSKDSYWLSNRGPQVLKREDKHIAEGTNPFVPKPVLIPRSKAKAKVPQVKKEKNAKMRIGIQLSLSKEAFKNIEKIGQ